MISTLSIKVLVCIWVSIATFAQAQAQAMDMRIVEHPERLSGDEPFSVKLEIDNATGKASWLRAVFVAQDYDRGYFGLTQANDPEIWAESASDTGKLYFIDTSESKAWSGEIVARADVTHKYYTGPGEYRFKIGRYTQSGSNTAWSNEVVIWIDHQLPPSPTPEPTIAPTPQPTATPKPSKAPAPPPTAPTTLRSTSTPTATVTPAVNFQTETQPPSDVLGTESATESAKPQLPSLGLPPPPAHLTESAEGELVETGVTKSSHPLFLGLSGLVFIVGGIFRLYRSRLSL